jgi:hypothetical protein
MLRGAHSLNLFSDRRQTRRQVKSPFYIWLLPLSSFYKVAALTAKESIITMKIIPAIVIGAMARFLHAQKRRKTKPKLASFREQGSD